MSDIEFIKYNFKYLDKSKYLILAQIIYSNNPNSITNHDDGIRVNLDKLDKNIISQIKNFLDNNIKNE
jgi:hypothetical protein